RWALGRSPVGADAEPDSASRNGFANAEGIGEFTALQRADALRVTYRAPAIPKGLRCPAQGCEPSPCFGAAWPGCLGSQCERDACGCDSIKQIETRSSANNPKAHVTTRVIGQSQRDCVHQPKVARHELPWVIIEQIINRNAVAAIFLRQRFNPTHISHPIRFRVCATRRAT